jgi:drug/metabolite transporter (DMT)-like permease
MPFYVALFSIKLLPSEKITLRKILGITIGFGGIVIIFGDQLYLDHPLAFYGMLAVLISPAFSGLGTIVGKKAGERYHPVTLNILPLLYSALVFFGASLILERGMHVRYSALAVFSFCYLGVLGTAVAFVLYFWVLRNMSAVVVSLITFVTPPMALVWGWIVLGERISYKLVIGMVIIFSGIVVVRSERLPFRWLFKKRHEFQG